MSAPLLLQVIELGGYPDLTPSFRRLGFEPVVAGSMRQALGLLRELTPAAVVAEFNYGLVYGSRISNLETLIAALQRHAPEARLVALAERERIPHAERLRPRWPALAVVPLPVEEAALAEALGVRP